MVLRPDVLVGRWIVGGSHILAVPVQFLLHAGSGIEFFLDKGSVSLNYRFFHISNAGIKRPNIGLNSHVFSLGLSF